MVSSVPYARMPRLGVRSLQGLAGLTFHLTIIAFAIWARDIFFFPLGIAYLTYGMVRSAVSGIVERSEDRGDESDGRAHHLPFVIRSRQRRGPPSSSGDQEPPARQG